MTVSPAPHLPGAVLRPVRGHHAFEACVEQLATAIRLGVYPLGSTLPPERELASLLHVSRATLREAMAALREAGLVQTTRGRGGGTVVTDAGHRPYGSPAAGIRRGAALEDALDFRRVVEPGAARLAATRRLSRDQRDWLVESCRAVRTADLADHRIADSRLHLAIATLTGSPMVVEAVTRAQAALGELLGAIPVLRTNIEHSHEQHDAVVDAILRGDPDAARTAMEEHCDATSALLRGLIG